MAHKYRDEVVGKRFLSVSGNSKLKLSKISEWGWKAGVIRAATHKDNSNKDLQVLVEYDGTEWQRREWLSVYREDLFKVFLVEAALVWAERQDPYAPGMVLWPALTFVALVSRVDLAARGFQPLEFLHDHHLDFQSYDHLKPYKEWDPSLPKVKDYPEVKEAARRWCEAQDGQRILLTTPSVLVGYRVEVYRAEGTTQFYTAVIVGYKEESRELTVTDDTVLEEHNEDPCLLQIRLIGDGVVDSIMRGEEVGITPRRSRSSAAPTHHPPPPSRGLRGNTGATGSQQGEVRRLRRPLPVSSPATTPANKDKAADGKSKKSKRKGNGVEVSDSVRSKEDLENKGKKKRSVKKSAVAKGNGAKKKVLEEANSSSKQLCVVEVRVEDCLRRTSNNNKEKEKEVVVVVEKEDVEVVKQEDACRMDDAATTAALLRFPDDRSDSGVSSLRSGSGDERSGSRSSALSSSDEPQQPPRERERDKAEVWRDPGLLLEPSVRHVQSVQHQSLLMSHPPGSAPPPPPAQPYPPPPPLLSPHPLHHLPPPTLYPDMLWKSRGYQLPVSSHIHPATADELLERDRAFVQDRDRLLRDRREQEARELEKRKERERERERERDREREREKVEREKQQEQAAQQAQQQQAQQQHQERLDRERERLEKQRAAEQAVHKHFEESLRLAHQKRSMCWNLINSLPPPPRGGGGGSEEERKRVEAELQHREAQAAQQQHQQQQQAQQQAQQQQAQQQRLLAAVRERDQRERDRGYYPQTPQVQRPPSVPSKVEYPPPAHSRVPGIKTSVGDKTQSQSGHTVLPKAEPNFSLFGYPAYQTSLSFMPQHHDPSKVKQETKSGSSAGIPSSLVVTKSSVVTSMDRDRDMVLPNPPPLMSDLKNSVIVKNEGKSPQSMDTGKPLVAHSQSPKIRVSESHYLPPSSSSSQLKTSPYEYRSPSQSPHPLSHPHTPSPHHQYEGQNLASISKVHNVPPMHHRARQSPHPPQHRQSPHPPPPPQPHHRQSPHSHPHRQSPHQQQHPHPSPPGTVVYTKPATVGSYPYPAPVPPLQHYVPPVATPPKPKVSSPAPPHIYGKPTSGITSGTPVCRPQEVTLNPLSLATKPPLATSPYQQMPQHHPPPLHQVSNTLPPPPAAHSSAHSSVGRASTVMFDRLGYPHPGAPGLAVSVKPPPTSPSSRSSPLNFNPGPHVAVTPAMQKEPLDLGISSVLKEESESNPASPKRKSSEEPEQLDIKKRKSEVPSEPVLSRVSEPSPLLASAATTITTVVNTAVAETLEPLSCGGAPGTPVPCSSPAKPGSGVDSEKSNSPGPRPVHKLKKAWLQRHSGEDGTDDKDVVGSGSCVTLPLTLPKKETESVSIVSSLHTIGSMAVNSISKTKTKGNNRKVNNNKDNNTSNSSGSGNGGLLNGHMPSKLPDADDSSSSDPERKTTPLKRVPPKVKRKKGGVRKTITDDAKRKKSASSTDSEKESGSEKESDSGQGQVGKKAAGRGEPDKGTKDSGRKRGRRPKSSSSSSLSLPKNEGGEEPRGRKSKEEPPAPFQKPPISQLKKSGESFLQDGACFEVAPKLAKCRECRWTPNQRSRNMPNIFCRFYAFRRLRYTKNGQLAIAGFSHPHRDATPDDFKMWLPTPSNPPPELDPEMSKFLLMQVGDLFCNLLQQENEAISVHMSEDKTIAWKRVVQGVREMCDVCETTLFNFHWACSKCGFVVCIDCYKGRKNGASKMWGEPGRDRDDLSWLLCTNRQPHEQEKLMLTQIIAGDSLETLGRKAHESRAYWGIPMNCGCPLAQSLASNVRAPAPISKPTNGYSKDLIREINKISESSMNGISQVKKEEDDSDDSEDKFDDKHSPLDWLADVALCNEDKRETNSEDEDNYSTLRELLIRPSQKSNGSRTPSPANNGNNSSTNNTNNGNGNSVDSNGIVVKSEAQDDAMTGTGTGDSNVKKEPQTDNEEESGNKLVTLNRFLQKIPWMENNRVFSTRFMSYTVSKTLYPGVPHAWLSEGKLLHLLDSENPDNYLIFQDQWKRGQPVIVSDVTKHLDMGLWHPDAFAEDFGDTKNDLVNCLNGNLVPNQPMRKFWEGFEHFSKRLKDDKGNPMILKLKDWPPGEDFAEMLPSRYYDLMKVLPLGEYSQRQGRLNLASRLPECFVRPDLGPKMYIAYGSAAYANKGTTNLHLDISDAVNVMVYVSIPKDADNDEHIKEALKAIDEGGCDIMTRRRVREKGVLPGALWHIYAAKDADKIRDLLNKVAIERGRKLQPHHDPIHDQSWYLDAQLQERLYTEYGVLAYTIVQCLGDAVFIPAGAPHQVRNLHNCIKIAEDFVSPENVSHCFRLTQEFRDLSDTHSNHEDKLQIKNIMYHAVKDSLSVLTAQQKEKSPAEAEVEAPIVIKKEETDSS